MHILGLIFFGTIAFFWLSHGLRVAIGAARLPWLDDSPPAQNEHCPSVSVLFAARDEEQKLPEALNTLLMLDYPKLEIVAVDDRSSDETDGILDDAAKRDPRLKVVHIEKLPEGWLGKPHALQQGYEVSNSEWLLFTDADVQFLPDTIRRAITLARAKQLDHLTLMCEVCRCTASGKKRC